MARTKGPPGRSIRREFTLGEGAAEYDALLLEAFYETPLFRAAISRDDQRCFIVGRTGSGKSACFRRLEEQHSGHFISLTPDDLALQYITGLDVVKSLKSLDVHLDPLFIALWKHVIIIEIVKARYGVDSPETTRRFIDNLMERLRRDRSKQEALKYLEDFEGKFWCDTDERVREVISQFENQVNAEAGGRLDSGMARFSFTQGDVQSERYAHRAELVSRFQRIVNETQLPRMNKMVKVLDEDILDSPQHYTYVVIDDLDRNWADEKVTNDLIRCLFRAVVDLKRVRNLKVLVALRTNIFEALDFGRTGGQEEKFRALIHPVRWTEPELKSLLDSRVAIAASRHRMSSVSSAGDLLPSPNKTRGNPLTYILSRTLLRPRDVIAFFNECLAVAGGKDKLTWANIHAAEKTYSTNRLLALRDEWKPTFPGIDRVFDAFRRSPFVMDWSDMVSRLDDCALLVADRDFLGTVWMTKLSAPILDGYDTGQPAEAYQPLIRLLHNIGFIGCITSTDEPTLFGGYPFEESAIYSHDQPNFPDHVSNLRRVTGFTIHPAFRPALDIREQSPSS